MNFSRKFTAAYISITVLFIRLAGWLRNGDVRSNKLKSESFKADALTGYFAREYLPLTDNPAKKQISAENPETIWQFWDNPTEQATPEIVNASFRTVEKFKGNFDHKILNNLSISDYSDLPGYVFDRFKKRQMDYAHFSDLLRLNLLKNHGGIWMDATDYMTDFVPEDIIHQDFFVFLTGDLTHFPYSFMQSCFIRARKGVFLCEAWYEMCVEYWKKETKRMDYFQIHLMFKTLVLKNPSAQRAFAEMPRRSDDEIHQLTGKRLFEDFNATEWERVRTMSFFQKTTYKLKGGIIADAALYPSTYFAKLSEGAL
jgi:hypothetical protein